jgi:hypothetical protein
MEISDSGGSVNGLGIIAVTHNPCIAEQYGAGQVPVLIKRHMCGPAISAVILSSNRGEYSAF